MHFKTAIGCYVSFKSVVRYVFRYFNSDIDDCAGQPCQNGENCTDEVIYFHCDCAAGYTGKNCEENVRKMMTSIIKVSEFFASGPFDLFTSSLFLVFVLIGIRNIDFTSCFVHTLINFWFNYLKRPLVRYIRGERNGLGRREKRTEKIRETGETTLKNREKGEPAWKGRRENIIFLKLVIIFLDISLCL